MKTNKRNYYKEYMVRYFGNKLEAILNIAPKTALKNLNKRGKNIIHTNKWNDIDAVAHNKAFTVANIYKADVLQDVFNYVNKSLVDGMTLAEFKKEVANGGLINRMVTAGWTGSNNPSRLRVIFDTNIKMSYAKGKYQKLLLVSDKKQYWIYHQVERTNKRHSHSVFNGRKYRYDDPIWNTIFPPSDFGCACWIEATNDPTGVEDGADYNEYLAENKENYQLSPLQSWVPETNKYNKRLQTLLNKRLKQSNPNKEILSKDYSKLFENRILTCQNTKEEQKAITKVLNEKYFKDRDKNLPAITIDDLMNMTGAPSGSKFRLKENVKFESTKEDKRGLSISITHPLMSDYSRFLYVDKNTKETVMYNDYFIPDKSNKYLPKGIGTMALYCQAKELQKYGINRIDCLAVGDYRVIKYWSGYYVWPAIGFNSEIPNYFIDILNSKVNSPKLLKSIKDAKDMVDIMNVKELKVYWKKYGSSIICTFDVNENSKTYNKLIKEMKRKKIII